MTAPAASMRSASRRFIFPPRFKSASHPRGARARNGQFASIAQFLHSIADGVKRHGDVAGIAELGEFAENARVIDFAGAGMMSAGHVGEVDKADNINIFLERFDEVAFGDLLVEKVVEKLDMVMARGADHSKAFCRAGEKVLGILFRIHVLDEQLDIVFGSDVTATLENFDAVGAHLLRGEAGDFIARLHDEAGAFELAHRRDEIAKRLEKRVALPSVGEGEPDEAL